MNWKSGLLPGCWACCARIENFRKGEVDSVNLSQEHGGAMDYSRMEWEQVFQLFAKRLIRDAWCPTLAVGLAQGIVLPESTLPDCFATAAMLLIYIGATALFCMAVSWGIAIGRKL